MHHIPQQNIRRLKAAEKMMAHGKPVSICCRVTEVTQPVFCRWKQRYSDLQAQSAEPLTKLERDIERNKKPFAEIDVENAML